MKKPENDKAGDTLRKCADLTEGLLAVPRDELDKKQIAYKRKPKREKGKRRA